MRLSLTLCLFVFFCFGAKAQFQRLIVNEFSQGDQGNREYIELLVVGTRTCTDSTTDLRGWVFDDQNGWYGTTNGAKGHYRFKYDINWSAVPFGSIILIYNFGDKNTSISLADDPTDANHDYAYILPNTSIYLEQNAAEPVPTSAGPTYVYPNTGYVPTTNQWTFITALNNAGGDVISIVKPSNLGSASFSIGYGYTINPGYQSPVVSIGNVGTASNSFLSNSNYTVPGSWIISAVPTNETPGVSNGGLNTTWINSMRQQVPTITISSSTQNVCYNSNAQTTTLSYSATTNSPTNYNITWSASPLNSFAAITNALPSSPITIDVPAGTLPGTYTGYITVSNAIGTSCESSFTVTINDLPTVNAGSYAPVCAGGPDITLTGTPAGGSFSGVGVSGNIFTPPTTPSSYSITYTYTDPSTGCTNDATTSILVNGLPTITASPNNILICSNGTGTILTASGASTYSWSPGTGLSSTTGASVSANPTSTSTYTVTGTDGNGCSNSALATVNVSAAPITPVVDTVQPNCSTSTGQITVTSPLGMGFTYSIDGTNYSAFPTFTNLLPNTYLVTVKNNFGCISHDTSVIINSQPITPVVSVNSPTICPGNAVMMTASVNPSGSYTYTWTVPAGQTNPGNVANFSANVGGTYTAIVTTANGCNASAFGNLTVQANTPIHADDNVVCVNSVLSLTGQPSGGTWSGIHVTGSSFDATAVTPGGYTVTYTVSSGGCTGTDDATIVVVGLPTIPVMTVTQPSCNISTGAISFTPQVGMSYSLNGSSFVSFPNYSSLAPGSYTITVMNFSGCISDTAITINPQPTTPASPNVGVVQPSCTVSTGTIDIIAPIGFTYSIDGMNYFNQVSFPFLPPGGYTITVKNLSGCVSPATTVTIDPQPSTPPAPGVVVVNNCNGTSTLTATGVVGSVLWSNGATTNPIIVSTGGTYTVTQTANGCTSATGSGIATPSTTPFMPVASVTQPNCNVSTATIFITSPTGAGFTYSINGSSYQSSPNFSSLAIGSYSVTAKNGNGCVSPALVVNITSPLAAVIESNDLTGCDSVVLNGISYTSSTVLRDTIRTVITNCDSIIHITNIQINNPVDSYIDQCIPEGQSFDFNGQNLTSTGNYTTTYQRPGQCDSIVHLYLLVSRTISETVDGCGVVNYNGTNYTTSTILIDTIQSVVTNCDSIYHAVSIQVNPIPVSNSTACISQGQVYDFNGQILSSTGSYSTHYTRPNQCDSIVNLYLLVSSIQTQTINGCGTIVYNGTTYTSSTVVRDTIRSIITGCDSIIHVANIQLGSVSVSSTFACLLPGQTYNFNGNVLIASGQYTDTFTTANGCDSIIHLFLVVATPQVINLSGCDSVIYKGTTFTSSTILHETLSSALTGCDSILRTINIVVYPKPQLIISPDKTICAGDTVTLTASSTDAIINWLNFGTGNPIIVHPSTTTIYTAIATSLDGCINTASITIQVQNFDLVLTANSNPVIAGTTTYLQTTSVSSYSVLSWQPSLLFYNPTATSQSFVADTSTTVFVIARSSFGCVDSAFITLDVDPLGKDIFIPTAFTPNSDGKNDIFRILGGNIKELDLKIFNRWGQLIFSSHERTKGWDGSFAGKEQPAGVYVYTVKVVLKDGAVLNKKGSITLIR